MNKDLSRRELLRTVSIASAATVGAAIVIACEGGGKEAAPQPAPAAPKPAPAPAPEPAAPVAAAPAEGGELNCTDVSALSEQDKLMRQTLQYVDRSPDPAKVCMGCQLYVAPAAEGSCGACQVVKGPIHPKGYCTSWVAKTG